METLSVSKAELLYTQWMALIQMKNDVGTEVTSVGDAALINLLAQLMDDSNSPNTSYDDALDDIVGPAMIFGYEHPQQIHSLKACQKRKNTMSVPSPHPPHQKSKRIDELNYYYVYMCIFINILCNKLY